MVRHKRKRNKIFSTAILIIVAFIVTFAATMYKVDSNRKNEILLAEKKNQEISQVKKQEEVKQKDIKEKQELRDKEKRDKEKRDFEKNSEEALVKEKKEKLKIETEKQEEANINANSNNKEGISVSAEIAMKSDGKKTAFLTFDDGPTANITPQILDMLKKYNIKATFFVVGSMIDANPLLLKREFNEGHAIGNHSYSHDYKILYSNTNNFITDMLKGEKSIKNVLGQSFVTKIARFPGGGFDNNKLPYKKELAVHGYYAIDWNSLNGDAEALNIPATKLVERFKNTINGQEHLVILMHDAATKQTTVQALPSIIEYLKSLGYEFKILK